MNSSRQAKASKYRPLICTMPTLKSVRELGVETPRNRHLFTYTPSVFDSSPESSESESPSRWMRLKDAFGFGKKTHRVYQSHEMQEDGRKRRWRKTDAVKDKRTILCKQKWKNLKKKMWR